MELITILFTVVLCFLGFYFLFLKRAPVEETKLIKRKPGCYETPIQYNITRKYLPAVKGFRLLLSSYLFTSRIGKWLLIPSSLKRGHFDLIERLRLEEQPTYQPLIRFDGPKSDGSPVEVEHLIKKSSTGNETFKFASISDYYHAYRSGSLTPTDVAENVIKAIRDSEECNPQLRALVQWDEGEIRRMAAASTKRFKEGKPLSVMDGIPASIKEELELTPYILRVGTSFRTDKCTKDSTMAARLRSAGAVLIGMANMHELGMGTSGNNVSRYHRTARNPYNVQHYTGGSSSGSGSSVAAGLCPVSIGTDGGGSVRIPATFCGVVGLKGTFGRFSGAGCAPLAFTVSHMGPLCSTVRDVAIMYGMLAGPDPRDYNTISQPIITLDGFEDTNLKGIKIGIYKQFFKHADTEIVETCEKAVKFLEQQGAMVEDIEIAELEEIRVAHILTILSEFRTGMKEEYGEHVRELSCEDSLLLANASQFSASSYITANKQRTRSIDYFKRHIFNKVDVIITPATAVTAPRIDPDDLTYGFSNTALTLDVMRFVSIGNLLGIPCMAVPVGYNSHGLPIGLQIMGRWWEEHVILRIGNVVERYNENNLKKPQVYYDNLK